MEWQETINALGGQEVLGRNVVSGVAFVEIVERVLPRSAVAELKCFSHLSDSDLAAVIPRRTLTSIRRARRLTPEQSDRIARLVLPLSRNASSAMRRTLASGC